MCRERIFLLVAGSMMSAGVLLGVLLSPWWLLLSAAVGLNMVQASITGFCSMTRLMTALGIAGCDSNSPFG